MDREQRLQLETAINAITRDCSAPKLEVPRGASNDQRPLEPFGAWLLTQRDRGDWIDELVEQARADRQFPRNASVEDVRDRLRDLGADGDAFEQLADAERCWLSL